MAEQDHSKDLNTDMDHSEGLNTDMLTAIYRLAVVVLLAGILVVQWQILGTMNAAPADGMNAGPTFGDLREARGAARRDLLRQVPLVRIQSGSVDVAGTVGIDSASVAQMRGR